MVPKLSFRWYQDGIDEDEELGFSKSTKGHWVTYTQVLWGAKN